MSSPLHLILAEGDTLGAALRLRAAREGVSPEEAALGILRKALAAEIEEASGALPLAAVIQHVVQSGAKSA